MSSPRNKVQSRRALVRLAQKFRKRARRIVFTNGCFDILHAGHVTYLEKARSLGDLLIVGLNSDSSVRKIKGRGRPVNSEKDRLKVLSALEAVDYVTVFSEETPSKLISEIRPHLLVKGADWKEEKIVGAKEVRLWGGIVKRIRLVPGRSTTGILNRIRREDGKGTLKNS